MPKLRPDQRGVSLVEVLLASSILLMLVVAVSGSVLYGQESSVLAGNRNRAALLAEEAVEAVRNMRDSNWANLANGTYGLSQSGGQWVLNGSSDVSGIFTRQVVISGVDTNRKDITANITWQQNPQRTGSYSLTTRLTNWLRNTVLGWVTPQNVAGFNNSGNQDGLKIQVQGNYAYVVLNGANPDFVILNITNPTAPTLVGSLVLTGAPTNIAVSGNFAYVSSDTDTQELQIINISNPSAPTLAGSYNAAGTANATGVYVVGTTVYVVRVSSTDNEFLIVNASNPAAPTLTGSLNLNTQGNEVFVQGNYAYVASALDNQELQVVNITTPATPTLAGSLDLSGVADGLTIAGSTDGLVVGRSDGGVAIINVSTPAVPTLTGTFSAGGSVNDVSLDAVNKFVFAATSAASAEFQVINIATPATPILQGSVNENGILNGVAYHATQDRAYTTGATNNEEVSVYAPQ